MRRPKGWQQPLPIGRYWRAALVVFFNYGLDTGTVWKSASVHEPILWRHVYWDRHSPDRDIKQQSRWGWLFYRRVKTSKSFYRPMNRVVHAHIKSIMPENPNPDAPVFRGGGARPNARFQLLCEIAGIKPKTNNETGSEEPWELKDLRKTCATYYDEHVPESSIEILGHSVGGITYRHYAHRAPLAFKAIMSLPQPMAVSAILNGYGGECPCCRRRFDDGAPLTNVRPPYALRLLADLCRELRTSRRWRLPDDCRPVTSLLVETFHLYCPVFRPAGHYLLRTD
jgi:hypothetical protein